MNLRSAALWHRRGSQIHFRGGHGNRTLQSSGSVVHSDFRLSRFAYIHQTIRANRESCRIVDLDARRGNFGWSATPGPARTKTGTEFTNSVGMFCGDVDGTVGVDGDVQGLALSGERVRAQFARARAGAQH